MNDQAGATTRHEFLQTSLAVAGTVLTSSITGVTSSQPNANRPNLVFIYGEGQRADAISIAGNRILKIPNHDRIGHEGVRFTNAFCTSALCAPVQATVLTGLYNKTTRPKDNKDMQAPLPVDIPLFTELLRNAGYEVAIVGKVHVKNGWKIATGIITSASMRRTPTITARGSVRGKRCDRQGEGLQRPVCR